MRRMKTVWLVLDNGADIEARDEFGLTPLMFAAGQNPQTIKLLLLRGAAPNATDRGGATSLMIAREEGNAEIIQLLKEAGARE